jgi:pyridoxine 4-dehydrogenase
VGAAKVHAGRNSRTKRKFAGITTNHDVPACKEQCSAKLRVRLARSGRLAKERTIMAHLAGTFQLGSYTVHRIGLGAMKLCGAMAYGPPRDPAEAAAVLRTAIEAGIDHIDTSDYYGPHLVNQMIRETLAPYPDSLVLVTKVGARRTPDKGWPHALSREELTSAVQDNLRNLGLDVLPVVNLRVGDAMAPREGSIEAPFTVLAELQQQGLIRHLGVSNVTPAQLTEAQSIAPVVCVQNHFNLAQRKDDLLVDHCAQQGIAFVPYFPLGGFRPIQSAVLTAVSGNLGVTPMQVALAWLLHRAPNVLVIPGTSKVAHLEENIGGGELPLPDHALEALNGIGKVLPPP